MVYNSYVDLYILKYQFSTQNYTLNKIYCICRVKGKFYLRTNSEKSFGLGKKGTQPVKTHDKLDEGLNVKDVPLN